jgi:transposase InsO family protein
MSAYTPGAAGQRTSVEVAFAPIPEVQGRAQIRAFCDHWPAMKSSPLFHARMLMAMGMLLTAHGLVGSMSRGNPYDNAKVESFMKTLKVEAVYLMD